ncbi:type III secretion protein HrpB4 [Paraburkholderia sp.]|uniref:type III secretion protein HrpB4 n=1 Tax=Paraburkholderia sp. TaxID=1926495 RepID=UPI003D6E9040
MSDAQAIDGGEFADDFSAAFDEAAQYVPDAGAAQPALVDESRGEQDSEPDSADASGPFAGLAHTLAANVADYHQHRRTLFDWMHPVRVAALPYASLLPAASGPRGARVAEAFLASVGVASAGLPAFGDDSAMLIRLPVPDCLSVFRMRALVEHVYELRLWIDRPRRALLDEWLGPHLTRMLLAQRGSLTAGRELDGDTSADALAWRGFRMFERDCGWDARHPMTLLRFALPDEIAPARLAAATGRAKVSNASRTLVSQLPDLFPTRSW